MVKNYVTECDTCGNKLTREEGRLIIIDDNLFVMHTYCMPRSVQINRGYIEVKE